MITPARQEVLNVLAEMSDLVPELRFGQMVVNLSYLARGLANESIWDMEDEELLAAAKQQLEVFRARRSCVA